VALQPVDDCRAEAAAPIEVQDWQRGDHVVGAARFAPPPSRRTLRSRGWLDGTIAAGGLTCAR
jgi:hypothetical protein